ncbi:vWA domain-containing protein [Luteimonas aquatica]|uniref:vWA domain-containing protein n=1 Tax=Luteimonas aquatica TaxID=450364 RepID=UPI001F59EF01|nr:VWA domain-containing protein [Luteimonas aquatica]
MLIGLFHSVRAAGVPVSLRELLDLHAALDARLAYADHAAFYELARLAWVKDERHYDRFDQAFAQWWRGMATTSIAPDKAIPEDWLRREFMRMLTDEEKANIDRLGGLDALMKAFRERLAEQDERHAGGNRWIGTGGTSPFGSGGYHPEGMRVGPQGGGRSAGKVWERRRFRELADDAELGVRNLQLALRRLRRFARQGAAEEFDLDGTIDATARDAGLLNIRMRPERHNAVKVLLLLDIGGSMDDHVHLCEQLFTAARGEFKRLTHYYFHNCVYERLWHNSRYYDSDGIGTLEVLRTHPPDTKLIFVGDAAMAPHEVLQPGGSIEHHNEEAGAVWLQRLAAKFPKLAWLNPMPARTWHYTASNRVIAGLLDQRMYELTPQGIDQAVRALLR